MFDRQRYNREYWQRIKVNPVLLERRRKQQRERQRRYCQRNHAKILESKREYYQLNRAIILEKSREYRLRNKARLQEHKREYELLHPEIVHARNIARHISLDGCVCEFCEATENLDRHHPDYDLPLIIVIACSSCHKWIHSYPVN